GGIVFNDVFDVDLDRVERPERILPSGLISIRGASIFGASLLLWGILTAFLASPRSGLIAILISVCALLYDKYGKHHAVLGPLNMGVCRGLNLLLGMSIVPFEDLGGLILITILPVIFIAAVTLTSRGEVRGHNQVSVFFALCLDIAIASTLIYLGFQNILDLNVIIPFVALWLFMNLNAKIRAIINNAPKQVMLAVKTGVISLIPLNASYVAGFGHWLFALLVLLLLPLAILLSRKFSVT
ncbi:MAG: UbiA-like protein EboC, partial [Saprospiraceae bacterium]|nr:UbiA-like protein EboC [Saprospiraceae bacterium]